MSRKIAITNVALQQKKQNILLRTENERLEKKFIKVEFERNEFKALFEDE